MTNPNPVETVSAKPESARDTIERAVAALHNANRHDIAIELYELVRTTDPTPADLTEHTGHTPGPWYSKHNASQGLIYEESTGKNIAVSYDRRDTNLIAAAPELLDSLKRLLEWSTRLPNPASPQLRNDLAADRDSAYEAITKAEGNQ